MLLSALSDSSGGCIDLERHTVFFYNKALEGWDRLMRDTLVPLPELTPDGKTARVEVMLEQSQLTTFAMQAEQEEPEGFFGIGVYNSKSSENVGTLWRSAYQLGAAFIFTIGSRNKWEKTADTMKSWRALPAFRYSEWASFCASAPFNTPWVAVEMGGVPLKDFCHPDRAVYLLGAEDAGLPVAGIS